MADSAARLMPNLVRHLVPNLVKAELEDHQPQSDQARGLIRRSRLRDRAVMLKLT